MSANGRKRCSFYGLNNSFGDELSIFLVGDGDELS